MSEIAVLPDVTFDRVKDTLVNDFGIPASEISEGSNLGSLGLDSLDQISLFLLLEEEFDRILDQQRFGRKSTVGEIVNYIEEVLNVR